MIFKEVFGCSRVYVFVMRLFCVLKRLLVFEAFVVCYSRVLMGFPKFLMGSHACF